ncbi:hypothetical protein MGYG_09001 [Nannizzia gypsea CBS 118893]|uniref:Uncharacterized protein n=1 Tax=Arthroderma gypseum (strain ATCC MYA-4604 / CBS 118893) TaxID=535722 RepID=E4UPT0_ARTGP|nr:hypothetical protein MGYG_09001 [Nannizzia gypsea CBS 118893]EFQ99902.1 hypothetical protein MGYG_09001 [Nannizzia gypsea CBS 118893]
MERPAGPVEPCPGQKTRGKSRARMRRSGGKVVADDRKRAKKRKEAESEAEEEEEAREPRRAGREEDAERDSAGRQAGRREFLGASSRPVFN